MNTQNPPPLLGYPETLLLRFALKPHGGSNVPVLTSLVFESEKSWKKNGDFLMEDVANPYFKIMVKLGNQPD